MKVIVFEPGKEAYVNDIGKGLQAMQKVVNGYIQALYPIDDPVAIVLNDEGKINGSKANRPLYDTNGTISNIFFGTFFICGVGEEDFTDIPDELIQKYIDMFPLPKEVFIPKNPIRKLCVDFRPANPLK